MAFTPRPGGPWTDGTSSLYAADANRWEENQRQALAPTVVLTDAATILVDAAASSRHKVTLTASGRALGNPSNAYHGQTLVITIAQDATGGRTWTLGSKYRLPAGMTITASTAAGRKDKLAVQYDADDDRFDVLAFQPGYGGA